MCNFPTTIILRHRRENLKKCSLSGLEERKDLFFITYPFLVLPNLHNYLVLTVDAEEELSPKDRGLGLFLIDATWRLSLKIQRQIPDFKKLTKRKLPEEVVTAYPRRQEDCSDPNRGLASVEALFASYFLLQRDTGGLLDHYYWRQTFLEQNPLFKTLRS